MTCSILYRSELFSKGTVPIQYIKFASRRSRLFRSLSKSCLLATLQSKVVKNSLYNTRHQNCRNQLMIWYTEDAGQHKIYVNLFLTPFLFLSEVEITGIHRNCCRQTNQTNQIHV